MRAHMQIYTRTSPSIVFSLDQMKYAFSNVCMTVKLVELVGWRKVGLIQIEQLVGALQNLQHSPEDVISIIRGELDFQVVLIIVSSGLIMLQE